MMEQHPIRLVAFDLDGTLAESKGVVAPEMGQLLAQLLDRMQVAVMSGGAWHQFERQLLPALPSGARLDRLFLFPVSAAQCYRFADGAWRTVYDHSFSAEERERIMRALQDAMREVHFVQPERLWGEQVEDRGAQITFSGLGQEAPIAEKKVWDPDRTKRAPLFQSLAASLPDMHVAMNATTSIDITRKGISKAYGVERLSDLSAIPIADMLYIGDALMPGGNDAIVIPTGIRTQPVDGPADTARTIEQLLDQS